MPSKINWAALDAVYATNAAPKAPRARLADATARHLAALTAWDAADERAAIQEYCGGLPRAEAEARAFAVVKGVCWWRGINKAPHGH